MDPDAAGCDGGATAVAFTGGLAGVVAGDESGCVSVAAAFAAGEAGWSIATVTAGLPGAGDALLASGPSDASEDGRPVGLPESGLATVEVALGVASCGIAAAGADRRPIV